MAEDDLTKTVAEESSESLGLRAPTAREVGWLFLGGGVAGSLLALLRRERRPEELAFGAGLAAAGATILLVRRQTRMDEVTENIHGQLADLDPIARAQVLKAVAEGQWEEFRA